jgi:hypothetical protein
MREPDWRDQPDSMMSQEERTVLLYSSIPRPPISINGAMYIKLLSIGTRLKSLSIRTVDEPRSRREALYLAESICAEVGSYHICTGAVPRLLFMERVS